MKTRKLVISVEEKDGKISGIVNNFEPPLETSEGDDQVDQALIKLQTVMTAVLTAFWDGINGDFGKITNEK